MTNPPPPTRPWQPCTRTGRFTNGKLWKLHFDAESTASLTQRQAEEVVRCYVEPAHLRELATARAQSVSEAFADLLPTKPHLKSGDFGEMLSMTDLPLKSPFPSFPLYRWRMRKGRNDTVRGVDLLGIAQLGAEPSRNDVLVLCEVKTRSKTKAKTIVDQAYKGVVRDYTTRLADQLMFQYLHLKMLGDGAAVAALTRFIRKDVPPFRPHLVAAVVHETTLWDDGLLDCLPQRHPYKAAIEVQVTCVDNLHAWIEAVRSASIAASEVLCL